MKKTNKQKRFDDKHWFACRNLSSDYMLRINKHFNPKPCKRLKMRLVKKIANELINGVNDAYSGIKASSRKGVWVSFPSKEVSILTRYS